MHPTSSPALSVRQTGSWSILQTEQGEVGWVNVWKTQGGAVRSLTNMYSFSRTFQKVRSPFAVFQDPLLADAFCARLLILPAYLPILVLHFAEKFSIKASAVKQAVAVADCGPTIPYHGRLKYKMGKKQRRHYAFLSMLF